MKKIYFILIVFVLSLGLNAQNVFTVTKTTDPNPFDHPYNNVDSLCDADMYGTLQWAIRKTNDATSASIIEFDIPGSGVQTINLSGYLPQIIKPVTIDATTQTGYVKGSPTVVINGYEKMFDGLNFYKSDNSVVKGIGIENFTKGIIVEKCNNIKIYDCVINGMHISGSTQKYAMGIAIIESQDAEIFGNIIGSGLNAIAEGIQNFGIAIFTNTTGTKIGLTNSDKQNHITNCQKSGVYISYNTNENTISGNIIYDNLEAITLVENANNFKTAPDSLVFYTDSSLLKGNAEPNDIIEIFASTGNENANEYLTTVTADAFGKWQTNVTTTYDYFVASARDGSGNSSALSERSIMSNFTYLCFLHDDYEYEDSLYTDEQPVSLCMFDTICLGNDITFQAFFDGGGNGHLYFYFSSNYNLPSGWTAVQTPSVILPDPSGYGNYEYYVFTPSQVGSYSVDISIGPFDPSGYPHYTYYFEVVEPPIINITQTASLCLSGTEGILDVGEGYTDYIWNTGETTHDISISQVGTYSVTITDQYGCVVDTSIIIDDAIEVTPTISGDNEICLGESTIIGLTNTYSSYLWSTGETTQEISVSPNVTTTYTITVTDANGCEGTASYTVTVNQPPNIFLDITNNCGAQICNGSATVYPQTPDITYVWSTSTTLPAPFTIDDLCDNIVYSVTATDNNGCSSVETFTITTNPNPTIGIQAIDNLCYGDCEGVAAIYFTGPGGPVPPPVSYEILPQSGILNTINPSVGDLAFEHLCSDDYTLTVTDGNGCFSEYDFTISSPSEIIVTETITNVTCFGGNDGSISVLLSGGVAPYNYSWSTGGNTNTVTGLSAGTYTVTVTDANNCSVVENYTLTEPTQITLSFTSTENTNCTNCDGTAMVVVSGGTVPYSFEWSDAQTTPSAENLCAGTYSVTVTDANNCTATGQVVVTDIPGLYNPDASFDIDITNGDCYAVGGIPIVLNYTPSPSAISTWDFGDGTTSSSGVYPMTHQFQDYGYMCITHTVDNGCATATHSETVYVYGNSCGCNSNYDITDAVYNGGGTVHWNSSTGTTPGVIYVDGDIFVTNNTKLSIEDVTVYFSPKGRIIIDNAHSGVDASSLDIRTSILTSIHCNFISKMWQGIEVWGAPFRESTELQNYHGVVFIKGSKIENAHIAILSGARDMDAVCDYSVSYTNPYSNFDWTKAGGVIKALNNEFFKNGIDILYLAKIGNGMEASENNLDINIFNGGDVIPGVPSSHKLLDKHYNNTLPNPYPNQNNPWAAQANQFQMSHAGIIFNQMKDVYIKGSDFKTKIFGIKSNSAQFDIGDNHFLNTQFGIDIREYNPSLTGVHQITHCSFTDISGVVALPGFAIGIFGGNKDLIEDCEFYNGTYDYSKFKYGMKFSGTENLNIVENTFDNIETGIVLRQGVTGWIGAGGTSWDGNKFTNCDLDIYTQYDNHLVALKCNQNNNTGGNQFVWKNTGTNTSNLANQGHNNGLVNGPAGNQFSNPNNKETETNISYDYYYHLYDIPTNNYRPTSSSVGLYPTGIDPAGYTNQQKCEDNNPVFIIMPQLSYSIYPYSKLPEIKAEKQDLQINLDNMLANIDGGNTQALLTQIENGGSQYSLRNNLINNSPLSDTVVQTLMQEDALNPWFFFQVMIYNTPVSRNNSSIFADYIANNEPWFLRRLLKRLQGDNPFAETPAELTREIGYKDLDYSLLLANITRNLSDTLNNRLSDAVQVLEDDNSNASKRELFGTYLSMGNYTMAQQKLSELQGTNPQNDNFVQLGNILLNLAQQNKTIYQMDSVDYAFVNDLAYQCPEYHAVYSAKSIVYILTGEEIEDCPDNLENRSLEISFNDDEESDNKFDYPNLSLGDNFPEPVIDNTTIAYELPEQTKGQIVVRDMLGQTITTIDISEGYNLININTKDWKPGVYLYSMELEGYQVFSKKMVISN